MNNSAKLEETVLQVPIEDIIPNRFQPRLAFDDDALKDLAASIKQHGIIQPLVLRRKNDKYEIIAGERRYKAAKMAGLAAVPAIISNLDDNASAEVAIVENVQRKDLTAIEEAKSYQALLDKGYMTQEELAKKMGLSQSAISNKLRLLALDESVQEAILQEKISERHARTLLKVSSHDMQKELLNKTIKERLTVKQLEEEIKKRSVNDMPQEEITKVNNWPEINNMQNNIVNIDPFGTSAINTKSESSDNLVSISNSSDDIFATPEKMPNKFFNFLEDTAVNMGFDEPAPISMPDKFNNEPVVDTPITEEIEMLDFDVPSSNANNNNYLNEVINSIRNLNLDKEKVKIEELDLPTEYQINIKIKKDNN